MIKTKYEVLREEFIKALNYLDNNKKYLAEKSMLKANQDNHRLR